VKVAIVGGGIAGLCAARRLESLLPDAELLLVERDDVLGGKVRTELIDGFLVEAAPDSFLARKERGVELCQELGLADELVGRRPEHRGTFVRRGDQLYPLPEGLTGMVPGDLDALEASALLSPDGAARFSSEPDVPPARGDEDESVASFVSRRFGREAYEALVEPLVTGIYGGDGELLSLRATFPQLRALERAHGSLLRGLATSSPRAGETQPFVSLRSGMGTLPSTVVGDLERTRILTGRAATRLRRGSPGYELELADGESILADGVILATPAFVTAELVADLDPALAEPHAEIPYGSSVVVTIAYAERLALDGYGYVVPRSERTDVLACSWTSQKWEGRAPEGTTLVRVFAGRFGERDLTTTPDGELVGLARTELRLVGIAAEPIFVRVRRWPRGMPQYLLGHVDRVERMEAALREHPGLAVAGAAYEGVGIPDCIRSGEAAASAVAHALAPARA
jgi:protoporphyrinogen/coproporphyrinogen III oxidase